MKITIPVLGLTQHGGIRILIQIANYLATQGHEVTFIYPQGRFDCNYELQPQVRTVALGMPMRSKILTWVFFLTAVIPHLKNSKIIANHFLTFYPAIFASFFFKKTSYTYLVQGIEFQAYSKWLARLIKPVATISYHSKNIIAANKYLEHELLGMGAAIKYTMRLGIDQSFFSTPHAVDKKFDIIYFARHEHYKRLDRFLRIAPVLTEKGVTIICVTQNQALANNLLALGFNVQVPTDQISLINFIDQAKAMLLTSDHEGFSLPPLECMARGLPAVLYECGGPAVYARHAVNSFIVQHDDEVIDAIMTLVKDKGIYQKMHSEAIRTAAEYHFTDELDKVAHAICQT